ncbi:hypothetical protein CASFOL_025381 [Castilleja foliolosa]|uniref:Pectin acetylesterase n=1 Tax=Castilleja foliolosa TaxID=1961234 RepID=A0ABD3CRZ1_9LAMI
MLGRLCKWLHILVFMLIVLRTESLFVSITYLQSAVAKGAFVWIDRGYGAGINNWLVQIEGGGWCNNVTTCLGRKNTRLGSSKQMAKLLAFSGILNKAQFNPAVTKLHYRGARIFLAVIEDLLAKGMKNAENAILSGCSAGGLASILHCDSFKALLPMSTRVKCFSDTGYFINTFWFELSSHQEYLKLKARFEALQRTQRNLLGEDLGPLNSKELESVERQLDMSLKQIRSTRGWLMAGEIAYGKSEVREEIGEEKMVAAQRRYTPAGVGSVFPPMTKVVVVGYALTSKKIKSFLQPQFERLASHGMESCLATMINPSSKEFRITMAVDETVALESPVLDMNTEVFSVCDSAPNSGDRMEGDYCHNEVVLDSDDMKEMVKIWLFI